MEQLDFLLIFTMDVKTYSCAIWYLQFMFEEFELGKHMGENDGQPLSTQETFYKWNQKWGAEVLFLNSITFAFLMYIFRSRVFCLVLV